MADSLAASFGEWLTAGKSLLELFRVARDNLPKGEQREQLDAKIKEAEQILARSDAKLAQDLGYDLCKCTFPPTPMLYRHSERASVCQNEACGNRKRAYSSDDHSQTTADDDYDPLVSWRTL